MLDRKALEAEALMAVCACWYYDLADYMDVTTDSELLMIICFKDCSCEHE